MFQFEEFQSGRDCVLECGPDKTCFVDTCCATAKASNNQEELLPIANINLRQRSSSQALLSGYTTEKSMNETDSTAVESASQKPTVETSGVAA